MTRFLPLSVVLSLCLSTGAAGAGESLLATDRASGLSITTTEDGWTVHRGGAEEANLPLPQTFAPYRLEAIADGWLLAGTVTQRQRRDLVLIRGGKEGVELLEPPKGRSGTLRDSPVPLVEDGRFVGLAWMEGDRYDRLAVRAAARIGDSGDGADRGAGWGPIEEVSPGPRVLRSGDAWSSQLALTGAVLDDGAWLLLWSAFDGEDDEIVWSQRRLGDWSAPRRLDADDRVPDVTPTVVASSGSAVAAWSAFDDGHYRLAMARLEDGAWRIMPLSDDRGATDPHALRERNGFIVVYRTVEPDGVHLLELDPSGRIVDRRLVPADGGASEAPERLASAALPELVYLAFGDSITAGSFDEANLGGYPGRLGPALGCSPGVCSVDNQGKGGERTGQAVSRIDSVLAARRYDIMLLMEGTNDIFRDPPISNNTIQFNLETIADKAEAKGVEPLLASIIWFHPDGTRGTSRDDEVQDLRNRLQGVAAARSYSFADPWTVLCPNRTCFNTHYFGGVPNPDPVGHPDASGYDIMTGVFAAPITAQSAPGVPTPVSPIGQQASSPTSYTWDRESPVAATWYQVQVGQSGQLIANRWFEAADTCSDSSCGVQVQLNLAPGTYEWRVRGRSLAGYSAWAAPISFTVEAGSGPTLSLVSGGCAAAPEAAPTTATVSGTGFPSNGTVGVVMAGGSKGLVLTGEICPGTALGVSEPFVLPATFLQADPAGEFTLQLSGEECFVQALALSGCQPSNVLTLP